VRRARGSMQELISAANVAGLFNNRVFGRRVADEWTMLVVLAVERVDEENTVTAEFLDSREGESTTFSCRSELPILEPGDFINLKRDQVSFVHKDSLWTITFTIGDTVVIPKDPPPEPPAPTPPSKAEPPVKGKLVRPFEKKTEESWGPMTEAEMVHFNSDAVGLGDLFAKLEPIVRAYAREHTRKPPDVSRRLNAEGHRTAAGNAWTPRLVRFLLALMFNDTARAAKAPAVESGPVLPRRGPDRAAQRPVAMDDTDEIARRLSSLGRVKITKGLGRPRDPGT